MNVNNQKLMAIKNQKKIYNKKIKETTDQQKIYELSKKIEQFDIEENHILKEEL